MQNCFGTCTDAIAVMIAAWIRESETERNGQNHYITRVRPFQIANCAYALVRMDPQSYMDFRPRGFSQEGSSNLLTPISLPGESTVVINTATPAEPQSEGHAEESSS